VEGMRCKIIGLIDGKGVAQYVKAIAFIFQKVLDFLKNFTQTTVSRRRISAG